MNKMLDKKLKNDRTSFSFSKELQIDLSLLAVKRSNDTGYNIKVADIIREAINDLFQKYNHKSNQL